MKIRINKFVSRSLGISRRAADKLISSGQVLANKEQVVLGQIVDDTKDIIVVNGKTLKQKNDFVYYALYKPVDYVSTTDDRHAMKKVVDLVPSDPVVYPVGRLDKNSEGLMILTNDGEFANRITHPRYGHTKKYIVTLNSKKNVDEHIQKIISKAYRGVRLTEGMAKFDDIKSISGSQLQFIVTIHQGWKRQIRRMFERMGYEVVKLKRISIGNLDLRELNLKNSKFVTIKPKDVV